MKTMSKEDIERISKEPHSVMALIKQHLEKEKDQVKEMLETIQNNEKLKQIIKNITTNSEATNDRN